MGWYDDTRVWYETRKKQWEKLTNAERDYISWHPDDAQDIERDAKKALAESQKRFGAGSLHNGAGDFRHCYWSALLPGTSARRAPYSSPTPTRSFPVIRPGKKTWT
jgi:hypothetical protein